MKIRRKDVVIYGQAKKQIQFLLGFDVKNTSHKTRQWMAKQLLEQERQKLQTISKVGAEETHLKHENESPIRRRKSTFQNVSPQKSKVSHNTSTNQNFFQETQRNKQQTYNLKYNKLEMRLNKLINKVENFRKTPNIEKSSKSYRKASTKYQQMQQF